MSELRKKNIADEEEGVIDLRPLFRALWKGAWVIALAAVLAGILAFLGTKFFVTPTYRTSFTAYVHNRITTEGMTAVSSSDLSAAKSLVNTYAEILKSRTVLDEAAQAGGLSYTYSQMKEMVSTSVSTDTGIVTVYVTSADPVKARDLAEAIANTAPSRMAAIVEGSSMQILDPPVLPTGIYTPNYEKNTLLGILTGAFLAAVLIVLRELLDDRVKDEQTLEARFGLPVLGTIPDLTEAAGKGGQYGYSRKGGGRQ